MTPAAIPSKPASVTRLRLEVSWTGDVERAMEAARQLVEKAREDGGTVLRSDLRVPRTTLTLGSAS